MEWQGRQRIWLGCEGGLTGGSHAGEHAEVLCAAEGFYSGERVTGK
jgi:hypothetical protein